MAGFIFGAGTPYKSYEDLQRARAIADSLAQQADGGPVRTVPEGLMNLGTGIVSALMRGRANKAEAAGKSDYNSKFTSLTKSLLGGGKSQGGSVAASSAPADVVGGIKATAESLGIDPVDLATAISYETAGTFDPTKKGPTTKWGQHRGLIQFGEPQAAKYGVDWSNPVGSQLGPDGAVARYLKDTGVKPGMGLLDIYSAINAGGVGRYDRSDAAAGGAPGTVADKVRDQMAAHRAKAVALVQGGQGQGGVQIVPAGAPPPQAIPASAPPPQVVPASAPAMGNQPTSAYQDMMRRSIEKDGPADPAARAQMAAVGVQQGQPSGGGGFFTSMLPMDAPPEQVAQVQQAEQGLGQMPIEQVAELASSPYAEPWQQNLMQQYLKHRMEQQFAPPPDPLDQRKRELEVRKLEQGLQPPAQARPATAEEKKAFGLPPDAPVVIKPDGTPDIISDGKMTIDNRQMGNIPPGYQVEYDAQGRPARMIPIPGGPAAVEADKTANAATARDNKRMTMTDTVTGAADKARELIGNWSTGLIGQGLANIGITDAAEVKRQVGVLTSNASIENLTAMRRESPTGGALGAVSDKENAMLAAAAGALDPNAGPERFREALDNYELTLMRIIHGYDAGTQIFEQRKAQRGQPRNPAAQQQVSPPGENPPPNVDAETWRYMTPEERALWQN